MLNCVIVSPLKTMNFKPETLNKIHELYPDDKATGYGPNELRGIWVIEMNDED